MSLAIEMLLGCLFVNSDTNSAYIILTIAIIFAICFVLYEIKNRLRIIIVILSLLFAFGFFITGSMRYKNYLNDKNYFDRIEEGDTITFQGELAKKEKKTTSYYLYFKNVITNDQVLDSNETIILQSDSDDLSIGTTVVVEGKKVQFNIARNEGNYDEKSYYNSNGTLMKVKGSIRIMEESTFPVREFLYRLRKDVMSIYVSNLPGEEGGIISAMTLGDKSSLDSDVRDLFKLSGIFHILAISGLHISILGMSIYRLMRNKGVSMVVAGVISSTLVILYAFLTFGGVSTIRAVIMFLIMILAEITGEGYDSLSAIGASLIFIIIMHPYSIDSMGFIFSFTAVAGIAIVVNPLVAIYDKHCKRQILGKINKALLGGILIQLVTLPIVCVFYNETPIYVVLLNCIIVPFLGVLLGISIIGGGIAVIGLYLNDVFIVGVLLGYISDVLLWVSHIIIYFYEMMATISLNLPMSRVITGSPSVIKIVIYYVVLFIITRILVLKFEDKKSVIVCVITLSVITLFISSNYRCDDFEMDVIDVGQGDGIFVAGDNNYFFDGGSSDVKNVGTYRILPFLKYKGIRHIDYWFVSHVDSDHMSGLLDALDSGYSIDNIVVDKYMLNEDNYQDIKLRADNNGVNIIVMNEGDVVSEDNLRFTCIFGGSDSIDDINGNSLVLLGEYTNGDDTTTMLIGGDMTSDSEECVLESISDGSLDNVHSALSDVDILKVSHHGSKSSSMEEFLKTISPKMALISAGVNNRYHHPSTEVIERLDKMNIPHLCTIDCGRLRVTVDNESVNVERFLE